MPIRLPLFLLLTLFTTVFARAAEMSPSFDESRIESIQQSGETSGFAMTPRTLYRTDDNGENWRIVTPPLASEEWLAAVKFSGLTDGLVVVADSDSLSVAATTDGGASWVRQPIILRDEDRADGFAGQIALERYGENFRILIRLPSSSNFYRYSSYVSPDGGRSWSFENADMSRPLTIFEETGIKRGRQIALAYGLPEGETVSKFQVDRSEMWLLTSAGSCEGVKTGCVQETRIRRVEGDKTVDITPPRVAELARTAREQAKLTASNSVFALPPNGNTRISLSRGFDKCTAATSTQMQTWWNNSPFSDVNIYFSGRNRGCTQAQLTPTWVNNVTAQGWGLIPTVVGYQSPCSVCTSCQKHSSDAATAEQQGRGEADIAITDASNLGLTAGTILYYDMERYDDVSGTGACSTPTKAFLKGWTDRLKELGYKSGVYGSPFNANGDWINMAPASQPDVVWLARWNNVMSVWGVAPLPDTFWTNHQRIHQWLGPRDETWGGVLFNIDNNISDAPVASAVIAKNKRADFDGDGKTDVSVWRPETGVWYVANSGSPTYSILGFGLSTDVMTPGDYDGDGKTDFAVWRPADGVWHLYSRSNYRSFAFGSTGDIPAPADYDGDGRTDAAVFRPSTGVWYILNSFDSRGTSFTVTQFGLSGDVPVAGDYDGDGKADIAVFRPSTGVWYLLQSTAGFAATQFGVGTDVPVPADYDGDGKTDVAVFRDGVWYVFQSRDGVAVISFGSAGDVPSAGDYDGDGKYDPAVFRPSTGVWYAQQSGGGYLITQFGVGTDRPVPRSYTP